MLWTFQKNLTNLKKDANTLAISDVEMLDRDYIESNYPDAEKVDTKTVQYIEELSRLASREPSSIGKDELLAEAKRIKYNMKVVHQKNLLRY